MVYSWSKLLSIINFQRPKPFQTLHVTPIPKPLPCFGATGSGSRAYMDVSRRHFWEPSMWLSGTLLCLEKNEDTGVSSSGIGHLHKAQLHCTNDASVSVPPSKPLSPIGRVKRAQVFHSHQSPWGWIHQFSWGVVFWRLWNEIPRASEFGIPFEETQSDSVWTKTWNI